MGELRYHHIGIPTDIPRAGEVFLPRFGMYVLGYDTNPYGIEWIRFTPDSPLPDLVKRIPHIAFETDDLAGALAGRQVLIEPNSPSEGVMVAFIVHNGAPVEFLQFSGRKEEE